MKIRYRLTAGFVGLLLVLLISLSGQPPLRSNAVGQTTDKLSTLTYTCNGKRYLVKTLPIEPIYNPKDSILITQQLSLLERTGKPALQKYVFVPAIKSLDSILTVKSYSPFKSFKGEDCLAPEAATVGASIEVEYNANSLIVGSDPVLNLHYVQVVTDSAENTARYPGETQLHTHPPGEAFLDIGEQTFDFAYIPTFTFPITDPYYPHVNNDEHLGMITMKDIPQHSATKSHTWKAQLYLAQQNEINQPHIHVAIYDGIQWGFEVSESIEADAPCNTPNNQSKSENKQDNNICLATAHSANDPHLVTFDGLKYDMQTVGEFTLIKANSGTFEVQARQTPYGNSTSVSINSAVAIRVGSDRVALYAQGLPDADTTTPLRVNGKPTAIQGNKLALTGGGEILKQGGTYVVSAPTGEKVLVSSNGSFLNLSPVVHNRSGKYSGLLGNVNGKPSDDLQVRGGKNVLEARSTYGDVKQVLNLTGLRLPGVLDRAEQVYFDQLYKEFANSWRVKQEESLFDYPTGKTTESYVNPGFPDKYLTLNMLSPDQIQKAQTACTEANVVPDLMEGCIFDVGFSGFSGFARTTAEISGYIGIVNQLIPGLNIPTPEQAVNQVIQKIKPKVCVLGVCL